jgi:hypothetical protein
MANDKPRVLILTAFEPSALRELKMRADVIYESWLDTRKLLSLEELVERIESGNLQIVVIEADFIFDEVFENTNKLRLIGVCRASVNNVDIDAATKHGVLVVNTPARNAVSVAELTAGLMLSLARRIPEAHSLVKSGQWLDPVGPYISMRGLEMAGKVAGIVGFGAIGSEVARMLLLNNAEFLQQKSQQPNCAAWFRSLYLWLAKYPILYKSGKRWQTQGYHQVEFVLTADGKLSKGGDVWLPDLPPSDPMAKTLAESVQQTKPTLHPDILGGVSNEQEQKQLRGFLTGFTGVQLLDGKRVCKEALLPKIQTSAAKPQKDDLLEHTKYCYRILGTDVEMGLQFWVVTTGGDVKLSKETLFSKEFKPNRDWETNQIYVPGLSFISPAYLEGTTDTFIIEGWRQFLRAGGVKDDPDNGVEVFAMNYAQEKLQATYSSVTSVEKLNLGFDFKVSNPPNPEICVEVKGSSKEQDVELTPAETETADKHGDSYQVCIVYQVPENPGMYIIANPCKVIKAKKIIEPIKIPPSLWKSFKTP